MGPEGRDERQPDRHGRDEESLDVRVPACAEGEADDVKRQEEREGALAPIRLSERPPNANHSGDRKKQEEAERPNADQSSFGTTVALAANGMFPTVASGGLSGMPARSKSPRPTPVTCSVTSLGGWKPERSIKPQIVRAIVETVPVAVTVGDNVENSTARPRTLPARARF